MKTNWLRLKLSLIHIYAHPYPYGFGCDREDMWKFDPTEPVALVKMMVENCVDLLSNSGGNPYYIYPQVTRPFDKSSYGIPTPEEHPRESMARLFAFTRTVQQAAGSVPVVGNGYTWLRQFLPYAGAANPVSYTHLDVYKRQPSSARTAPERVRCCAPFPAL